MTWAELSEVNPPTIRSAHPAACSISRAICSPASAYSSRIWRSSSSGLRACDHATPSSLCIIACTSISVVATSNPCEMIQSRKFAPAITCTMCPAARRPLPNAITGCTSPRVPKAIRRMFILSYNEEGMGLISSTLHPRHPFHSPPLPNKPNSLPGPITNVPLWR